jgi:hypothetical protein
VTDSFILNNASESSYAKGKSQYEKGKVGEEGRVLVDLAI